MAYHKPCFSRSWKKESLKFILGQVYSCGTEPERGKLGVNHETIELGNENLLNQTTSFEENNALEQLVNSFTNAGTYV